MADFIPPGERRGAAGAVGTNPQPKPSHSEPAGDRPPDGASSDNSWQKYDPARPRHSELRRRAVQAARQAVLTMRDTNEIGDDAFHAIEEELDWLEMAGRANR